LIEFVNRITIERPISEVFRFVSNLENIPKWNYFVLRVEKTSDGPLGVGSEFHQTRKTDRQLLQITEFEPPRTLKVISVAPSKPEFERSLRLTGDGEITQIRDEWKLALGVPRPIVALARTRVSFAVRENLGRLKELLEVGTTTLQDGRVTSA
jgi:uncharacterized protein YndB with AHSA1/START domain